MPWCVNVYVSVCEWEGDRQRLSYLECVKYLEYEILYLWSNLWNWGQCLYIFYYTYISIILYIYMYMYVFLVFLSLFSYSPLHLQFYICGIAQYDLIIGPEHLFTISSLLSLYSSVWIGSVLYLQVYCLFFHNVESALSLIQWNSHLRSFIFISRSSLVFNLIFLLLLC